jgi:hypothetical protein
MDIETEDGERFIIEDAAFAFDVRTTTRVYRQIK